MIVRKVKKQENKEEIARLMYNTDPYIFPYWFKEEDKCVTTLIEMMEDENNVFNYENIIVAEIENKIVGFILYLKKDNQVGCYDRWLGINEEYNVAINDYVKKIEQYRKEDCIYIALTCVNKDYRRKHVAKNMFEYLFSVRGKNKVYKLDVLKGNIPAINLYDSLGFYKENEIKGFNGKNKIKPAVYTMRKNT